MDFSFFTNTFQSLLFKKEEKAQSPEILSDWANRLLAESSESKQDKNKNTSNINTESNKVSSSENISIDSDSNNNLSVVLSVLSDKISDKQQKKENTSDLDLYSKEKFSKTKNIFRQITDFSVNKIEVNCLKQTSNEELTEYQETNPFSPVLVLPGMIPYFFNRDFINEIQKKSKEKYNCYFLRAVIIQDDIQTSIGCQYLLDLLDVLGGQAQIFGNEGTGKTTLLRSLRQMIRRCNHSVFSVSVRPKKVFGDRFWKKLLQFAQKNTRQKEKNSQQKPASIPSSIVKKTPENRHNTTFRKECLKNNYLLIDRFDLLTYAQRYAFWTFCRSHSLKLISTTKTKLFGIPTLFQTKSTSETLSLILDYLLEEEGCLLTPEFQKQLLRRSKGNIRQVFTVLFDLFEKQTLD